MFEYLKCLGRVLNYYSFWGSNWKIIGLWWSFPSERVVILSLRSSILLMNIWGSHSSWKIIYLRSRFSFVLWGSFPTIINLNRLLRKNLDILINSFIQRLLFFKWFDYWIFFHLILWRQLPEWLIPKMNYRLFLVFNHNYLLNFWWNGADWFNELIILDLGISSDI